MPLVSVIMNCHNASKYLSQALDSVRQQTFRDYEIIFWDNQSTDSSGEIALSYGEPLRYFRGNTFLPLGAARNKAIEQAQGKYIALLDCDDVWLADKLEKQMALFATNPDLGMIYSDAYIIDAVGNTKATYFQTHQPHSQEAFINLLMEGCFISCETVVFKKEVWEAVGGFRADLNITEDYDLFLRIAFRYRISYVLAPLTKWREHQSSFSKVYSLQGKGEIIDVVASAVDMIDTLSKEQAKIVRRRLAYLAVRLILGHVREGQYARALPLTFELTKKYLSLAAKLRGKAV